MAWTTPLTWQSDQLVGSDDMNTYVRDNQLALKNPDGEQVVRDNSGDYSDSSVSSFEDVDATNLICTVDSVGGDILVTVMFSAQNGGNAAYFDIDHNGTRLGDGFTLGLCTLDAQSGDIVPVFMQFRVVAPTAGTHIFKLQWMTAAGNTVAIVSNSTGNPVYFDAREL